MAEDEQASQGGVTDLRASLEEVEAAIKKLHAPLRTGDPRRHHYVPRFLLRQFSGPRKQLMRIVLPFQGEQPTRRPTHINKLAVVKDFYTAETGQGPSAVVENYLAEWDNQAAGIFRGLRNPEAWPIADEVKLKLSIWIALSLSRSPHFRRLTEVIAEFAAQTLSQEADAVPPDGTLVLHQNHHIQTMLHGVEKCVEPIYNRRWMLVRLSTEGLVLPDINPIMLGGPPDPQMGVGLATATELLFPIDRSHLLCMHNFGPSLPAYVAVSEDTSSYLIQHYNNPLISGSYAELFCHPDDYVHVIDLAKRHGGAPLLSTNSGTFGKDVDIDGANRPPRRRFPRRHRSGTG